MKLKWYDYGRWVLKAVLLFFIFRETGIAVVVLAVWFFLQNEIGYFTKKAEEAEKPVIEDKTREAIC